MALDRQALAHLSASRRVVLVSGTNGKTTTTSLLASALGPSRQVVTNLQGANLPMGLVSALAEGPPDADAVLEVDEAWLPKVVRSTRPAAVALLNLTRDQLDRNNEVRTLAGLWRSALAGDAAPMVVANVDDPLVVWGAGAADRLIWVAAGQPWTQDSGGCPSCGGRIDFNATGWRCGSCDFARPKADVDLNGDTLSWSDGRSVTLELALPGRANRANAAIAVAVAVALEDDPDDCSRSLAELSDVAGRYATVTICDSKARLLLAKNPAGWLETFDILAPSPGGVVVVINARLADGRDPSWLWDVPFERLQGRFVIASGERAWDLAVRLRYGDVEHTIVANPLDALREAGECGRDFDVVANYTAFQEIRSTLRSETPKNR
jgi:UDP-N-acetylmuramyl tripeptide synthase